MNTSDPEERSGPSAWDSALRLLGVRARSAGEMRERLTRKGFEPDVVDDVMDRLQAHQLLDDDEFATEWVRSRHTYSGRGRIALKQELRAKGVAADVIDDALSEIDPAAERAVAADLVARKVGARAPDLSDRAERDKHFRRLVGMLARRGYPQSLAIDVVNDVLSSPGE